MKRPLAILRYLLSIHILSLTILSILRSILYLANTHQIETVENKSNLFLAAMLKGIQFDNTMSCYIIALPLAVLLIYSFCSPIKKIVIKIFNIYFIILYGLLFFFSAADIPYFAYNFTHIGGSVFNYLAFGGDTANMLLQETSYYIYFVIFILVIVVFAYLVTLLGKKLIRTNSTPVKSKEFYIAIPSALVIFFLCFLGIRGTVTQLPIRVSDAYFCNNTFFNQLGVNPAFFFIKSTSNFFKKYNFLEGFKSEKEAITYTRKALNISGSESQSPLLREIKTEGDARNMNVVIVLMESFTSEYLSWEYNNKNLTPNIHSLINESYYFENFYSAGIHTNNGIGATLYGYPPLFAKSMMGVEIDYYDGLPAQLNQAGYNTLFFITGNPTYDNMNSFLFENGFQKVYSESDYDRSKRVNNFGVQDDYLLKFGIERMNELSEDNKPFLATFLTVSNHPPYVIPDAFKNKGKDDKQKMIAYVDNTIGEFLESAKKQAWYDNTIFVFLGDHGHLVGSENYEMPLCFNHIPLIIHSAAFTDAPKKYDHFGGQIDVYPTIMGLLNRSYTNNTLGIDLFKETRPCMFFTSDTHLGCVNDKYFYTYNLNTKTDGLYSYRNNGKEDLSATYPQIKDSLKDYASSMLIVTDYMVKNKLTNSKK